MQQKPKNPTWGQVSYTLYFVGAALVAASWFNLVSGRIGWMGWIISMTGWAVPHYMKWRNDRRR